MDTTNVLERAAAGDESAWVELVDRNGRLLRTVAAGLRVRGADAEDAAQTTWMTLHENITTVRDPEHVGAWLRTVMRRRCLRIQAVRRREQLGGNLEDRAAPEPAPPLAEPDTAALWGFVDRLPDRERKVLRALFDGSGRSFRQVAVDLSMPVGSLGPVRMRALRRLASILTEAGLTESDLRTVITTRHSAVPVADSRCHHSTR